MNIDPIEDWLVEATIAELQRLMESGRTSSEALVEAYVRRIRRYDGELRSVLEINPDALDIARELDRERARQGPRSMLHGIPMLLKDNIDSGDRMHTSAGSLALAESFARRDAFVASRLRAAGAVLLGKANMTEWANFMSGTMWAGYSARGGLTLNPYGPGELFVGGSSSGSAAATAANLCAASVGTETSGSIISPASHNGLVGIKPTVGLVSRAGIIPISASQDTAGPIARTVTDAAILLGAMAGTDPADAATMTGDRPSDGDYRPFLKADGLDGKRIGVPRYYFRHLDPPRRAILEEALVAMGAKGAVIVDPVVLPCEGTEWNAEVLRHEFKKGLNDYLSGLDDSVPVRSLQELIAFNERHADKELKYGQGTLVWSEQTDGTLTDPSYLDSLAMNGELARKWGIDYALREHRLDALVFLGCDEGADLAARAGYPSVTVPGGYAESDAAEEDEPGDFRARGPQGITFVGAAFGEPTLLEIAYAFEQATRHRRPPRLFS